MMTATKPIPYPIPESAILSACLKWLWAHGCYCWRNNSGKYKTTYKRKDGSVGESHIRYGLPGSGDIIGTTRRGQFISVEVKRPGKSLEPHQALFRDRVLEHGGIFILAHGIEDLEANKALIS